MKANLTNSTIEMTKTEAAAAGKLNSEKFNELKALREMFPTFQIVIAKPSKNGEHFKGLTVDYMEKYIQSHNPDLLSEFYTLRGRDEKGNALELAKTAAYGELRKWFLNKCHEVVDQFESVHKIIEASRTVA